MAANTSATFPISGDVSTNGTTGMSQLVTAAAADYTGISANYVLVATSDGTNGSFIQRIRAKAGGTNTASVARVFINNGSTVGTATNNCFYGEFALPATTASNTAPTIDIDYPMNFAPNAGFKIYVGIATAVAAGWTFVAIAGKY